jgi:hypothetical protein
MDTFSGSTVCDGVSIIDDIGLLDFCRGLGAEDTLLSVNGLESTAFKVDDSANVGSRLVFGRRLVE